MANIFRLRRRAAGGAAGAPSALKSAEPAYNEQDDILYYGKGDDGGANATSIIPIGGKGAFADLTSTQTIGGGKTFSTSPIVPTPSANDNSTKVASTAYVDAAVAGAGIANNAVTNAKLADMAVSTIKGRVTAGTGDPEDLSVSQVKTLLAYTKGDISLGNVDNTADTAKPVSTAQQTALDLKAPLASPALTGTPTTPTASPATNNTQIASTAYVDAAVDAARAGLDVKGSVRAASAVNVTLTAPGATIGGVAMSNGDSMLLYGQSTGSQNGIYVWNGAASTATRRADADASAEVTPGMYVFVEEGTDGDNGFVLSTDAPITLGTTALVFAQFTGAGQITAGTGLTKTGNTLNAIGTTNRISVGADNIDIDAAYVGQTSITTLGTIGTGTWQGTVIAGAYGGLGAALSSIADGSVLKRSGTAVVAAVAGTDYLSPSSTIDGGTF